MENTSHTWILKYKVHGAIEFGKDNDRLYYNIFTDYDVAVKNSLVTVMMPASDGLSATAYRAPAQKIEQTTDENKIVFNAADFKPYEALTINIAFPKNIITKTAFWKDWFMANYGFTFGAIIILLSILTALIRWIVTEVIPKGRGTIIPRYNPPQNLTPAIAQLIIAERLNAKTWASTLIDLAVRDFVKIEEEKKSFLQFSREYIVTKTKPFAEDKSLREYEKKYLKALFAGSDTFSTKEMKKARGTSRHTQMRKDLEEARKLLLNEVDTKTNAFVNKLTKESKYLGYTMLVLFIIVWGGGFAYAKMGEIGLPVQPIILILAIITCAVVLVLFFKFEARLSQKGREMKEEWLGFKMYLEVAEKYRMQNLTPDLFEKFLPYTMIFNVEKKWAKNFEAMHLPAPEWYHSAMIAGATIDSSSLSSFSPSGFSSSFISSFSSSFSSCGGGGGGGGGSAGGGGGGGGGEAR